MGTNGDGGGRNKALIFVANAGDDPIADVLLHYADPDDSHPSLKIYIKTSSSLRRTTRRKPSSVSPTALTRSLSCWAFLESSSTTCCVPANSGQ